MKRIILGSIFLLLISQAAYAVPVFYNATGTCISGNNTYGISGYVVLSDVLLLEGPRTPVPAGHDPYAANYGYLWEVTNYSLNIGSYSFSGSSGYISFALWPNSINGQSVFASRDWWLNDEPQTYVNNGYTWNPLDSSGNRLDPYSGFNNFLSLPSQFELLYTPFLSSLFTVDNGSMILAHSAAPVPEPATIFLLASGLLGISGTRIRNKYKKK